MSPALPRWQKSSMRKLIAELALNIYLTFGGTEMMAMLFAQRVILGKTEFDAVPAKLKVQVAEILIESGLEELVPEEYR